MRYKKKRPAPPTLHICFFPQILSPRFIQRLFLPKEEGFQDEGDDDGHDDHGEQVEAHKVDPAITLASPNHP